MTPPCANCPWRRDAEPGYWASEHFDEIERDCQGDGLNIMLCHKAGALPDSERGKHPCRGWLAVVGFDAIGARLLAIRGEVKAEEVGVLPDGVELYASFDEMLEENRAVYAAQIGET